MRSGDIPAAGHQLREIREYPVHADRPHPLDILRCIDGKHEDLEPPSMGILGKYRDANRRGNKLLATSHFLFMLLYSVIILVLLIVGTKALV